MANTIIPLGNKLQDGDACQTQKVSENKLRGSILVLALMGIGIAGYLTYVHFSGIEPVCSGSGGCVKVQASDQARLLGVPVAALGLNGYVMMALCALSARELGRMIGCLTGLVGAGFSMYLTYVSVTQIKATCQWCLASTTLMVLLGLLCTIRMVRYPENPPR